MLVSMKFCRKSSLFLGDQPAGDWSQRVNMYLSNLLSKFFSTLGTCQKLLLLLLFCQSKGSKMASYVVICIFQISDDTGSFSVCILATRVSLTSRCVLMPLTICQCVICPFLMISKSFLYVVINFLLVIHVENIFFQFITCIFTFFNVSSDQQVALILIQLNSSIFSLTSAHFVF